MTDKIFGEKFAAAFYICVGMFVGLILALIVLTNGIG
jgi:hypothetical protein